MLHIELNHSGKKEWPSADFLLSTRPPNANFVEGDVGAFYVHADCENASKEILDPNGLRETIQKTLPDGVRAMIGNAGCEVTFRQLYDENARENIDHLLRWAKQSYEMIEERLVLAPMDYDLIHDEMTGGRLLNWAAEYKVPLVIFCGYRFLFKGDEFEHIRIYSKRYDFRAFGNPYQYPFEKISEALRGSKAEVWTGAGFEGGLQAGSLEKAEKFGFKGVLTKKAAWETYFGKS